MGGNLNEALKFRRDRVAERINQKCLAHLKQRLRDFFFSEMFMGLCQIFSKIRGFEWSGRCTPNKQEGERLSGDAELRSQSHQQ